MRKIWLLMLLCGSAAAQCSVNGVAIPCANLGGSPVAFGSSTPVAAMPQSSNLVGAYLLNEGTGTVANDTSGNGNNATISGGFTWEGQVDLDNTTNAASVTFPSKINSFKTFMGAFYVPIFGTSAYPQAPGYGNPGNFNIPTILCGSLSTMVCIVEGSDYFFRKNYRFFAAGTDNTEGADSISSGWHTWGLVCGSASPLVKTQFYIDGQEVGGYLVQGSANTCGSATTAAGNFSIGTAAGVYNSNNFVGKLAGAWFWTTQLSRGDIAAAHKYAFDFIHAKGVPNAYRSVTTSNPRILAVGDSRTFGVNLTPSTVWPATMVLTDTTYDRVNIGFPSATALDLCTQFDPLVTQQKGLGPIITMIWGWTNDSQMNPAQAPRDIANSMKCLVQKAKLIGRVIVATDISLTVGGVTARYDATKNAVNAIVRAEAFGWGVDNIADLATEPVLGADGASLNTTYFVDGAHQTLAGEAKLTPVMQDAANELLGSAESNHNATTAATYAEIAGDRFLDLTGTAAQTVTLPTCVGKALPRYIGNVGSVAGTIATTGAQTLTGSAALAVGARAVIQPIPGAPATGGCTWRRIQ
jgi:hypothetical protein